MPFPFTDLSSSKKRPAVVVSPDWFNSRQQDVVLAAITSQVGQTAADASSLTVGAADLVDGELPKQSVIKLAKLFTLHSGLIVKKLCTLRLEKKQAMLAAIRDFLS